MTHLLFVEAPSQIAAAAAQLGADRALTIVAMTAAIVRELEARDIPHTPIGELADVRSLSLIDRDCTRTAVALARAIESFAADRDTRCRPDGPWYLSGQVYYIHYAIAMLVTRRRLFLSAIAAANASKVSVFGGFVEAWFSDDGYARNPWFEPVEAACREAGIEWCELDAPADEVAVPTRRALIARGRRGLRRLIDRWRAAPSPLPELAGMRLLFGSGVSYDWTAAIAGSACEIYELPGAYHGARQWAYRYSGQLRNKRTGGITQLEAALPQDEEADAAFVALAEQWHREAPAFVVDGFDVAAPLWRHVSGMAAAGPAHLRAGDRLASSALDAVGPDAVCFFAMPWLQSRRLALAARRRNIPVLCYQHGGAYGTHDVAKNETIEITDADIFLTYGDGVLPPADPPMPAQARFVAVGSARIARMAPARAAARPSPARVLWLAEAAFRNTFTNMFMAEDTRRYASQKRHIAALTHRGVPVVYRPMPENVAIDGTSRWIQDTGCRARIDVASRIEDLIRRADVVVSDTSSGTSWNEILAIGVPLILYCDPAQTRLRPHFAADLDRACWWCRSDAEFAAALEQLADDPAAALARARGTDRAAFLRRYVLHDGTPAANVARVLSEVAQASRMIEAGR